MAEKKLLLVFLILFFLIYTSTLINASPINFTESLPWQENISAVFHSSLVLGDIDLDGKLDLVSSGCVGGGADTCTSSDKIRVYLNNGTSFIENQTWQQNLTNLTHGSLALGDIDNDGDLDLIRAGNIDTIHGFVKVYLNNGTSFIENQAWQQNLTSVTNAFGSSLALWDIDNDGRLDLALVGADSTGENGIYINNGTAFVKNSTWLVSMPLVGQGSGNGALALSDIDNDGDLDIIFIGSKGGDFYTTIYINNGSSFEENSTYLQGWRGNIDLFGWPSLITGDIDSDGHMDLVVMGTQAGDKLRVYNNTGTNFTRIQTENGALIGIFDGSLAVGDYNNNGTLDFVAMGKESSRNMIYENNYATFIRDNTAADNLSKDIIQGSLAFGDIDNDTDLDLILIGLKDGYSNKAKIYLSNASLIKNNTLPKHPNSTDFSASYTNNQLALRWGNGSDNETPINGLYYNLRVGTTSGGNQIVSGIYGGSSNPTAGYFGNMMQRKSITLHGSWLQANTTYYWSVQTIDTGLAKSNWSTEQTYSTAADITYPTITINFPNDNNYTSFSNVTFNATVSDNVNISNVSLYGLWGNWHRNQTNSSGLNGTSYIFQANLSAYGEGSYIWAIRACDTTNNCIFSANRTVIRDLSYPLVYLESPDNASTWTANNSVTFSFNVTDFAVQNCSLIVGSSLKYNFTSVTVNTSTSATVSLDNGNYNWSVNCTDMLLRQNKSETRTLTVNYQAPSAPLSSGGGGSGGGVSYSTYSVGELKETQEINKELGKGDRIKFSLLGENHSLEIKKVTSQNATIEINSSAFNFTLAVNESRKFNLTSAEFYDLFVKLNDIKFFKANLTITSTREDIPLPKPVEEKIGKEKPAENITMAKKEEKPFKKEESGKWREVYWWAVFGFAIISLIIYNLRKRRNLNEQ